MIAALDIAWDNARRIAHIREYSAPFRSTAALYAEKSIVELPVGLSFAAYWEKRVY